MEPSKNNDLPKLITDDGREMEISPRGSLALLAFGAAGLDAWRQVRLQNAENNLETPNIPSDDIK